jgi:hypothetical protein
VSTPELREQLRRAINLNSAENGSHTPDRILADFLATCLAAFDTASNAREQWYGAELRINGGVNDEVRALRSDVERIRAETIEECAKFVENGRFLSEEAPAAQFARECSRGIRRLAALAPAQPETVAVVPATSRVASVTVTLEPQYYVPVQPICRCSGEVEADCECLCSLCDDGPGDTAQPLPTTPKAPAFSRLSEELIERIAQPPKRLTLFEAARAIGEISSVLVSPTPVTPAEPPKPAASACLHTHLNPDGRCALCRMPLEQIIKFAEPSAVEAKCDRCGILLHRAETLTYFGFNVCAACFQLANPEPAPFETEAKSEHDWIPGAQSHEVACLHCGEIRRADGEPLAKPAPNVAKEERSGHGLKLTDAERASYVEWMGRQQCEHGTPRGQGCWCCENRELNKARARIAKAIEVLEKCAAGSAGAARALSILEGKE